MKKKFFALCAACVLLLSLTACGGSANGGDSAAMADMQTAPSAPADYNYNGAIEENAFDMPAESMGWDAAMPEPESPAGGYNGMDSSYGGVPANAKIIYTADMDLETKEFEAASKALADIVEELGGYFESRSVSEGGYYRSLNCTVRVPVKNFVTLLDRAGEAAHVTGRSEYLEDVSEAYYDQEARLTTQRIKLERLQELLSKAENMADIITIESAISDTELEIEYLTGSLRKYDSQINYSTVNLCLREVYRLSTDEEVPVTFGQRFAAAFSSGFLRGVEGLEDFVIGMARNWVMLLLLAAIVAIAILLLRRGRRKRAERIAQAAAPKEAAPEKPEEKKED